MELKLSARVHLSRAAAPNSALPRRGPVPYSVPVVPALLLPAHPHSPPVPLPGEAGGGTVAALPAACNCGPVLAPPSLVTAP